MVSFPFFLRKGTLFKQPFRFMAAQAQDLLHATSIVTGDREVIQTEQDAGFKARRNQYRWYVPLKIVFSQSYKYGRPLLIPSED